ncbi:MAG: hypothetical protein COS84_05340 [Armatimonadetes bacterium CG07_land_8_20_14_0_80_40_9]|nr:MAG: hypothetical protein COS84_05340 [Armatimonadetes bacterium CG07_land_8_20_14_0_80_40_9]
MKRYFLGALLGITLLTLFSRVFSQPGTIQDPVITKSYLEKSFSWQIVTLLPSQEMTASRGCQIIIRVGKAGIVEVNGQGLLDLTKGVELKGGEIAPLNHLLFTPRGDGRGIKAETRVVLLVKGRMEVK